MQFEFRELFYINAFGNDMELCLQNLDQYTNNQQQKRPPQHRLEKIALNLNQIKIRQAYCLYVACTEFQYSFPFKISSFLFSIVSHQERISFLQLLYSVQLLLLSLFFLFFSSSIAFFASLHSKIDAFFIEINKECLCIFPSSKIRARFLAIIQKLSNRNITCLVISLLNV